MVDRLFGPRQWWNRRQAELNRLVAIEAAALAAGMALQPSAPEGAQCDVCSGSIVGGVCLTCDAVFVSGIRVPGKKAPLPFTEEL